VGALRRQRTAADITREDLASCFHMPSEHACRRLGIGLTVLKRQCRKFGIKRWPFRKMKSLDRLITNVQAGITPGENGRVVLKSVEELEAQKRAMEECAIEDLDEQTKRLQQAFSKASHKLRRMATAGAPVRVKPRSATTRAPRQHASAERSKFSGTRFCTLRALATALLSCSLRSHARVAPRQGARTATTATMARRARARRARRRARATAAAGGV
jgi:hypothetical protein